MLAYGTMLTAHAVGGGAAVDAFVGAMAVDMFPGGSLETSVSVRGRTAVDTVFFIIVMPVKAVQAFRTAGTIGG
jgi:hypothetical protein